MAKKTGRRKRKLKNKSSKKPLRREFSAGGVVFKRENNKLKFLIVQPKGTNRWQLPKGQIDKGESSGKTAVREVEEEGGLKVKLLEKLGDTKYFYVFEGQKTFKVVTFYLMKYLSDIDKGPDEVEIDKVKFVSFNEAKEKLTFKDDGRIVEKAKGILASRTP